MKRALRAALGAIAALVLVVQLTRVLAVGAPALEVRAGERLGPVFADPHCTAAAVLAADDPADKWAFHGGDGGRALRCVSEPFALPARELLLARYAGDPRDPAVHAGLDLDGDGVIDVALAPGRAARHGWLHVVTALPPGTRAAGARLVIDDASARPDGWLAIRDLVAFDGAARDLEGVAPWPRAALVLGAALLAAGALWQARAGGRALAALALVALLALEFLQASSYYLRDEYVMLERFTDGIAWREVITYYDQFAPLFLAGFAGAVALARDWYAPLQVAMFAGHATVALLLVRLLERHGCARELAVGVGLLYATAWTHVDVVPWFMEGCFLVSTGLALAALERTVARTQGRRGALWPAALAATAAPLVFAGGAVAPWLCLAYLLLYAPRDRAGLALFAAAGIATCALILAGSSALDSARLVTGGAAPAAVLRFLAEGVVSGSLAALLALRGHPWLALGAVAAAGAAIMFASGARALPAARALAFGALWMLAGYVLQAVVRTGTGYGEALSFRYTYFGMTGTAFALAAWLQPLAADWGAARASARRLVAGLLAAACVVGVAVNAGAYAARVERHEREYFDGNRQYLALTAAALARAGATAPPLAVPKSLYPGNLTATPSALARHYHAVVCYLAACVAPGDAPLADAGERAMWAALLEP